MLKQDVPLRTGWFGYRKLDVENCIAHIRAAYAAELRLARQTQQGMEETMAQLRQENKALRQRFAQQAAVAHAVYQPEQRHPVEVAAAQQEHLVQWLSKRLGRPLTLPVLTAQGFELVGGRLLPGETGARAQFMYQNGAGQRITLYLGALDGADQGETAFRLHADGPVPAFYWLDQGFGYALSGPLSREALLALATAVHQQL